jgi:sterol desaturase/sphingolipid hydroxylase (fatty acid hydroxylase superfamily)
MDLSESMLRGAAFGGGLLLWTLAESLWPRRPRLYRRLQRWSTNLTMALLGVLVIRALALLSVPLVAVQAALWAESAGIGLLNLLDLPVGVKILLSMLALDLLVWAQHVAFHRLPWLWRLHRVHHADRDLDASSGLRFHPVEILLSMLLKSAAVLALGAPAAAVVIFELILNGMAMFNHANLRLPAALDHGLRWLLVTPDMHRVHHSVHGDEQLHNFGFNLSVWDRLARCYRATPREGQRTMRIGLQDCQDAAPMRLGWSLSLPLQPPVATPADRDTPS